MYPYNIISKNLFPIMGRTVKGSPWYMDLSVNNPEIHKDNLSTKPHLFNEYIKDSFLRNGKTWAISGYLENREPLLNMYPQMAKDERYYHLGVDLTLPVFSSLYMPLDGVVKESFYEEGEGNYGGCLLIEHNIEGDVFYVLYGHLNKESLPKVGQHFLQGEKFALLGEVNENGGWFYHTHVQVLTKKAYENGWLSKGYCTREDIATIDEFCPNPMFLLNVEK